MNILLNCLIIFFVRIIDVSMGTLRTIIVIRGKRVLGSLIAFIEVSIWFLAVKQALNVSETNLWIVASYAVGFALGTFLGSWIEERIAIGASSIQVITRGERYDLVKALRDANFAVSIINSKGLNSKNLILIIEVKRKEINNVRRIINKIDSSAFITISDVRTIINGYI